MDFSKTPFENDESIRDGSKVFIVFLKNVIFENTCGMSEVH